MGSVIKAVTGILGGGSAPKVSTQAAETVKEDANSARQARAALFATEGGVAGATLNPNDVQKRENLLGN